MAKTLPKGLWVTCQGVLFPLPTDIEVEDWVFDRISAKAPELMLRKIDLRGKPGDIRYQCPVCAWGVTLSKEGVAQWTQGGTITPQCRKDGVDLTRTVLLV